MLTSSTSAGICRFANGALTRGQSKEKIQQLPISCHEHLMKSLLENGALIIGERSDTREHGKTTMGRCSYEGL